MRGAIGPWVRGAQALIALAFGAFVAARAVRVPLTYDEAATYIRYIAHIGPEFDAGPLAIFNFEVATNHLLSTALTKLATVAAGSSELVLRLPALLGYAMYLWFSAGILRRLTGSLVAVAGLLLLNLNPYLLDFFALSRGYGLGIGLMMGALSFWMRGDFRSTLLFASAAVLANFSMLNVYLALVLTGLAWTSLRPGNASTTESAGTNASTKSFVLLGAVAAVFAALVFSQDPALSTSLYEGVTVRLAGLNIPQLQTVRVSRVDLRGRVARMPHVEEAEDAWYIAGIPVRSVRIEIPASLSDELAPVELIVGNRAFTSDPHRPDRWIARDLGETRQFESVPSTPRSVTREFGAVMNWAGDRQYFVAIARAAGISLLLLAILVVLLSAAGTVAVRMGLTQPARWRTISLSVLWVAALAGPPLYLLRRDRQLYFGGTRGLVPDTFYSLIDSSLYGRIYTTNQSDVVFGVLVAIVAVFIAFSVRGFRPSAALPAAARVIAVIAIVCASLLAQRWLLGTVYLVGRTALFLVPLYLLFLVLFCQALIDAGRYWSVAGVSILVAASSVAAFHFAQTANLQYALDWRDDAATKAMITDLEAVVAAEGPAGRTAVLGTESIYGPAAVYYVHRHQPVDIDLAVPASSAAADFVYIAERHATAGMKVIKAYPIAGTVLGRPREKPSRSR
jgi:hypothetical protein